MNTMTDVVVAGHLCLDIIPTFNSPITYVPGRVIEVGPVVLATGGAVSNTGLALHRLGIHTRLVARVGDDMFGQAIKNVIDSYAPGLSSGLAVAPGENSSYTVILSSPNADRMFMHHPGCSTTFGAEHVGDAELAGARMLHFGYPPVMKRIRENGAEELLQILKRAKAAGLTTSIDMCMPDIHRRRHADWRAILVEMLPYVDVFMPNIEELLLLIDPLAYEHLDASGGHIIDAFPPQLVAEMGQAMIDMGAAIVGLKAGHRGLYLRTAGERRLTAMGHVALANPAEWAGREMWIPCYSVDVIGTTGSGDATVAGFLMGLLRGLGPLDTMAAACAVGACNVEAADALSGLRSWPETSARIAAGWPRLPLDLAAAGWRYDAGSEVWIGPMDGRV